MKSVAEQFCDPGYGYYRSPGRYTLTFLGSETRELSEYITTPVFDATTLRTTELIRRDLQEVIDESFTQYSVYLKSVERTHLPLRDSPGEEGMWELFERWHKRNRGDVQRVSRGTNEILEKPEG